MAGLNSYRLPGIMPGAAAALAGWIAFNGGSPAAGDSGAPDEQARAVLSSVERKYASVSTLRYDVTRRVVSERQAGEDSWTFFYSSPDKVRIDVHTPHERTVIVNGEEMIEYIPLLRKAVVTRLAGRSPEEREKIVSPVLSRVALEGIRPGRHAEMAAHATRFDRAEGRPDEVVIEGDCPAYRVAVDTSRSVLLSMEVRETDGQVRVSAEASDFVEAAPGFWMPTRLEWTQAGSGGVARCEARLSNVRVNGKLQDGLFALDLPSGTRVEKR